MEGVDIAGVAVSDQVVNALAHLIGRLIGECHAEDVLRKNAEFIDQKGKAVRKRPGLARARARDHAHVPFGRCHGLELLRVKLRKPGIGLRSLKLRFPHEPAARMRIQLRAHLKQPLLQIAAGFSVIKILLKLFHHLTHDLPDVSRTSPFLAPIVPKMQS